MRGTRPVFVGSRRRRLSVHHVLIACAFFTGLGLLMLTLRSIAPSLDGSFPMNTTQEVFEKARAILKPKTDASTAKGCATVEEMGQIFGGGFWEESLKVRTIIRHHFDLNGASRVRGLPPEQFCRHGFVLAKASEAGFGNEMYKILTAAALSIMLNRGQYPFGEYISYNNDTFTLKEVKHLWRHNGCLTKYGRHLIMRIEDFQKPAQTGVLCRNWREWEQPIIWFQNTTDAVAAQFFLKNIYADMRNAASNLFGLPENLQYRPNVFGELMRLLITPSENIKEALNWVLGGGVEPDISLHMRMLMNRSPRAVQAALNCIRKAMNNMQFRPKVVLVSETPSLIKDIAQNINEFAEVFHFDYEQFKGNITGSNGARSLDFRVKDWGPAPRWVAFVDFFLASRAKHAVVSGAHRRVGTTYAQLIAALAAANKIVENSSAAFEFFVLQQLPKNQSDQCALTPLLSPAWWDGLWQSPTPRDIRRMHAYGIQLSGFGTFDEQLLLSYCTARKNVVVTVPLV
ncbi:hypothetical protein Acr_00g0033490 [Actinidia rufa]|uniref:Uncharacterized protein n=1 Tax=Actinidia rufa TaxID=165716 RepID=A0A7J0DFP1_9ERIC|nr:hypothetical protein Acr_00g0033490 [Actinidia rufa]